MILPLNWPILLIITTTTLKTRAQLPSPCPRILSYLPKQAKSDRWYANLAMKTREPLDNITIKIQLDEPADILGNWFASTKTKDNQLYVIQQQNGTLDAGTIIKIRFFVKYNATLKTPSVERILLNEREICPGSVATRTKMQSRFNDDYNASSISCGTVASASTQLILGGTVTKKGAWPWHVALYVIETGNLNYTCGGTLISANHVLTAAHCVTVPGNYRSRDATTLTVFFGKHSLKNVGDQQRFVSKIIVHRDYNYNNKTANDIAVLKIEYPVVFNDYVRPCCLWDRSLDIAQYENRIGTVVGWGYNEYYQISDILKVVQLPIVKKEQCLYSNPEFFGKFTNENSYCAGYRNNTGVCNGDSGGGMVFPQSNGTSGTTWQVRGIVSISSIKDDRCDLTEYVVFTDVAKYLDWIYGALQQ